MSSQQLAALALVREWCMVGITPTIGQETADFGDCAVPLTQETAWKCKQQDGCLTVGDLLLFLQYSLARRKDRHPFYRCQTKRLKRHCIPIDEGEELLAFLTA
ncbi:unnamed protein product, partial [Chrysoparadoxa australica]